MSRFVEPEDDEVDEESDEIERHYHYHYSLINLGEDTVGWQLGWIIICVGLAVMFGFKGCSEIKPESPWAPQIEKVETDQANREKLDAKK